MDPLKKNKVVFLRMLTSKNFYFLESNYIYFGKFVLLESKFKLSNF